ncbi:Long-chain-fatty-acid--CoA ligase ACSBG2 [Oopsacas minuta]|uniref:Long-chain-fatty-acid--CoA ligase ACSBG2 n=1 Tax=Oopsacas minuta TaxID=111878 RepID=A0AAV7JLH9_9METZ|nr:Long-chain-fatty-acid--CoA ligase ACSBG2 [Oopsacas minuta]
MATSMSQVTPSKADKMLKKCEERIKEILSIDLQEIRHTKIIQDYRNILEIPNILNEMERITVTYNVNKPRMCLHRLSALYQDYESIISSIIRLLPLKDSFQERCDQHLLEISLLIIDDYLPIDIKDSLYYIERTLAEPFLYSLNGLIMWKETAEIKIHKIQKLLFPELSKPIESVIVKRYESLKLRLKAEILRMRTYPIPEPWCSKCMTEGMTHLIDGEFIFYVDPELEEDMKPVNPSKRDLLPGGITRQEYDMRLHRLNMEYAIARVELKTRNADRIDEKCKDMEDWYAEVEEKMTFTFNELSFLYRDAKSLEYLVRKNKEDKYLKIIYDIIQRNIRHYYDNRIDIPSFAIDTDNDPMLIAPPKEERNIPVASGVDRGGVICHQLNTPACIIVVKDNVIVADRYGDTVTLYRACDLAASYSNHDPHLAATPLSLTYFKQSVFLCYTSLLVQFSLISRHPLPISHMNREHGISIPQACCTSSNSKHLYVGTLMPSLIRMHVNPLRIEQKYRLNPILHTKIPNRYPWLQDMKAAENGVICFFTGSPSLLQLFSLEGVLIRSILTEDQIVGAYNFNLFYNFIIDEWRIYICDFWDNSIKVFDWFGKFIETVCKTGHELCQIFRPSCIFIEDSGYVTVGDMKEDNCLRGSNLLSHYSNYYNEPLAPNNNKWMMADIGSIQAGGLSNGIYTTNSLDITRYILKHSNTRVAFGDTNAILEQLVEAGSDISGLIFVQSVPGSVDPALKAKGVLEWSEFIELGKNNQTAEVEAIMDSQRPGYCSTLPYTSEQQDSRRV